MFRTEFNETQRIWCGEADNFKHDKTQNFGDIILATLAEKDSDRVMQIDGDTGIALTKADIRQQTIRCAQKLIEFGCTPEQRIAIIARNHHSLTPLLFAAICIGSPVSPLDVAGDGNAKILQRIEPSFVFCDSDILSTVRNIIDDIGINVKLFTVNENVAGYESIDSFISGPAIDEQFVCSKITDTYLHAAVIPCSSGSTGISKSICLSHALFVHMFGRDDKMPPLVSLSFSSLYWFSGIYASIAPAFRGTRVFTAKPFSTDVFFHLVEKYKVQSFMGAPCQVQAILKNDQCKTTNLSSLRVCFSVGSANPSILVQTMKEFLPHCAFMSAYGITEIGGGISLTMPNELEQYPGTVGQLFNGVQIKIIDENTNQKCGIDQKGEIYIKTTIPSMGYFRDDAANVRAFDDEGFFITGDIGYFDKTGRLYISGRRKEMFKVRNFVIWPTEIEDVIQMNQAVRYACVVNVYEDEIASDLVAAVVVKNGTFETTEDDISKLVANRFSSNKHLEGGVYFVDDLPMTPSGKVIRMKVKEIAQEFYQQKKQKLKIL